MYLQSYHCSDCGTIFYAEEKQGILKFCPYCEGTNIEKVGEEIEVVPQICENCKWWKHIVDGTPYGKVGDCKSKEATKRVELWFRTESDFGCIFWEKK